MQSLFSRACTRTISPEVHFLRSWMVEPVHSHLCLYSNSTTTTNNNNDKNNKLLLQLLLLIVVVTVVVIVGATVTLHFKGTSTATITTTITATTITTTTTKKSCIVGEFSRVSQVVRFALMTAGSVSWGRDHDVSNTCEDVIYFDEKSYRKWVYSEEIVSQQEDNDQ
ncbi:hypothetical protein O3P69_017149 [Scylla paramamosain]|uniref:Uncharacterized protein n=1 Tax=Scylla paramamosain TaxID=85552 RepID=A0AAW0TUH7_SCYPA